MKSTTLALISLCLCVGAALETTGVVLWAPVVDPEGPRAALLCFEAWMLSPYFYLAAMTWGVRSKIQESAVVAAATSILVAVAGCVQFDAFIRSSPDGVVLFLWTPALQWCGALVAGVIGILAGRVGRSRGRAHSTRSPA